MSCHVFGEPSLIECLMSNEENIIWKSICQGFLEYPRQNELNKCFIISTLSILNWWWNQNFVKQLGLYHSCRCPGVLCYVFHHSESYSTHCRVTHICVSNLSITGSNNGLSPGWRQAIIWPNAGILLIRPLGTNFSEILIEINTFSFKKMRFKMSSEKWQPFCLSLNVLIMNSRSESPLTPVLHYLANIDIGCSHSNAKIHIG